MDTLLNVGIILYNKSEYTEAMKYFKRCTEVSPDFADGFYHLGMSHTALNNIPEAVAALKKFMEMAPDSPNYEIAKAVVEAYAK
jgi:tetratricopeptide (TPR) repeat protein